MKVGFIGVGNMGGPMCRNIIKRSNHQVTVFDLNAGRGEDLHRSRRHRRQVDGRRHQGRRRGDDLAAHAQGRRGGDPGRRRHPGQHRQGPDLHRPQHQRALDGEEDRRRDGGQGHRHARRAGERRHDGRGSRDHRHHGGRRQEGVRRRAAGAAVVQRQRDPHGRAGQRHGGQAGQQHVVVLQHGGAQRGHDAGHQLRPRPGEAAARDPDARAATRTPSRTSRCARCRANTRRRPSPSISPTRTCISRSSWATSSACRCTREPRRTTCSAWPRAWASAPTTAPRCLRVYETMLGRKVKP